MLTKCKNFVRAHLIPELCTHALQYADVDVIRHEDENKLYCTCKRPSFGRMIQCANDDCLDVWFHYECVGIKRKPKGNWFCKSCNGS